MPLYGALDSCDIFGAIVWCNTQLWYLCNNRLVHQSSVISLVQSFAAIDSCDLFGAIVSCDIFVTIVCCNSLSECLLRDGSFFFKVRGDYNRHIQSIYTSVWSLMQLLKRLHFRFRCVSSLDKILPVILNRMVCYVDHDWGGPLCNTHNGRQMSCLCLQCVHVLDWCVWNSILSIQLSCSRTCQTQKALFAIWAIFLKLLSAQNRYH